MKSNLLLTGKLMKSCDDHTINSLAIPSQVLMERAARGVVTHMEAHASSYFADGDHVLVLCGGGNNGGDGFAVARFLHEGTYGTARRVSVCYVGKLTPDGLPDQTKMSPECARQYDYVRLLLIPIYTPSQVTHSMAHANVIVDALFGIGLDRPITGETEALIHAANERHVPVVSVDIPSGIHSDSGKILGTAIKATVTVTMQALKQGLLLYPGADFAGELVLCDIGVDLTPAHDHPVRLADRDLLSDMMSPRSRRTHKGSYGQIALVCGSYAMGGAAVLAAKAALRSGAGLVRVVTPECNREILQIAVPEAILTCYDPAHLDLKKLTSVLADCDGAVIGCGFGTSPEASVLLQTLLDALPIRPDYPVVLDADALNLISKNPWMWQSSLLTEGCGQVILTPHPMEASRLTGTAVGQILTDPLHTAQSLASDHGVTVVLKDAHTVIAAPDGKTWLCPFGNAGMAKGGSGDVLAGIIGALAVQRRENIKNGLPLAHVAAAGVVLHGLAGDAAAEIHGEYAVTPSDLIHSLGTVPRDFSHTNTVISFTDTTDV